MKTIVLGLMFVMMAAGAFAEKVTLESGRVIEGRIIEVTDDAIRIISDGKTMRLPFRSMNFESAEYYRSYRILPRRPAAKRSGVPEEVFEEGEEEDPSALYQEFLLEGMGHAEQGEFSKAVDFFSRAIEARPELSQTYFFRAGANQELGKFDEAAADYSRLIQEDPENAELYARRGWVFQKSGRTAQALEDYTRSLELDPYNLDVVMERYALNLAQGRIAIALKDLEYILWLDPASVEVYLDAAVLNYRLENYYTAWQNVEKASQSGINAPPDFLEALEGRMPNPFSEERKIEPVKRNLIREAWKIAVDYAGFLFLAIAAGVLAVVLLRWPSRHSKETPGFSRADGDDLEQLLRPVVFHKTDLYKRLCAACIDLIVLSAAAGVIVFVFQKDVFAAVLGVLYLLKDSFGGASVGKKFLGLTVVDEHGHQASFFQGFLRNFTLGLPLIVFYVIYWTAGMRVSMSVRIALAVLWACFALEWLIAAASAKEGQRLGDRMAGVFVHDGEPGWKRLAYLPVTAVLLGGFFLGTIVINMVFNRAFIYRMSPSRYYNAEYQFSFVMPKGWKVEAENEEGLVLRNLKHEASFVFVLNEETREYSLELCVTAFTRAIEDAGLEKRTQEAVEISGLPGVKVGFFEKGSSTAILFVYFKKDEGGPLHIFQASSPLAGMQDVMSDVMDIVHSFRFE